jgi:hypothetical protein
VNNSAVDALSYDLIGNVPPAGSSALKGAASGTVLFFVCEYLGFITGQVPRIPVAWLMMVATVMVESVLFFRIIRLLHQPRRGDFNFIIRLDYADRITIATRSADRAHRAFVSFTGALLGAAAILELVLVHERSVMVLLVIPAASMLLMVAAGNGCRMIVAQRRIPCTHRDDTGDRSAVASGGKVRGVLARGALSWSAFLSGRLPGGRGVRLALRRNLLYLLRGEFVLSLLIVIVSPVIVAILIAMIHQNASPFTTAIPLAAVFMINYHFANELGEAGETLSSCYWYDLRAKTVFFGNCYTMLLSAVPVALVGLVFLAPTLWSIAGFARMLNFLAALAATVIIGCRGVRSKRNDADPLVGVMLFAGVMVGNFIPYFGVLFSGAAVGIAAILDGGKRSAS